MGRHSWKFYVGLTVGTLAGMHVINRMIFQSSGRKNLLFSHNGATYSWRLGDIFYTKQGQGSPVLFIHDLDSAASDADYRYMIDALAKEHTVYTMDLLGCGRSDKPAITYTAYAYVQLISDFIKDVIGEKSHLVAAGESANLAVLCAYSHPDMVDHINLINPAPLQQKYRLPKPLLSGLKKLIELPIVGTFLYNIAFSQFVLRKKLSTGYLYPYSLKNKTLIAAYEGAHQGDAYAKYLFASKFCHYTGSNILHALAALKHPITLLVGEEECNGADIANDYVSVCPSAKVLIVGNAKHFPQIENPQDTISQLSL